MIDGKVVYLMGSVVHFGVVDVVHVIHVMILERPLLTCCPFPSNSFSASIKSLAAIISTITIGYPRYGADTTAMVSFD